MSLGNYGLMAQESKPGNLAVAVGPYVVASKYVYSSRFRNVFCKL